MLALEKEVARCTESECESGFGEKKTKHVILIPTDGLNVNLRDLG